MNISEFKGYLEKFDLKDNKIEEYIKNKKLFEINSNIFLSEKEFEVNQIYGDTLLFINLKNGTFPSTFLLEFIRNNSKNILKLKSDKHKVNFTYGKSLSLDSVSKSSNLKYSENKSYLLLSEDDIILGIVEYNLKDKKIPLQNIFNIGEYLKEP